MTRRTHRERLENRADRLREWSDKRQEKSDDAYQRSRELADRIPFGQPILVGHHSEGRARRDAARIRAGMDAAVEHADQAQDMARRATEIEGELATSVYDDDPDAIARLEAKLAGLEAQRERIKAYNASCRKAAKAGGTGDLSILDDKQRRDITTLIERVSWQVGPGNAFPSYALSNLGGNISRLRKRIARLTRDQEVGPRWRAMTSRYDGECCECGEPIAKGTTILYTRTIGAKHNQCPTADGDAS